jgi:hypothetical protein
MSARVTLVHTLARSWISMPHRYNDPDEARCMPGVDLVFNGPPRAHLQPGGAIRSPEKRLLPRKLSQLLTELPVNSGR